MGSGRLRCMVALRRLAEPGHQRGAFSLAPQLTHNRSKWLCLLTQEYCLAWGVAGCTGGRARAAWPEVRRSQATQPNAICSPKKHKQQSLRVEGTARLGVEIQVERNRPRRGTVQKCRLLHTRGRCMMA